eukprot:4410075-Amphidinium_carterae.1
MEWHVMAFCVLYRRSPTGSSARRLQRVTSLREMLLSASSIPGDKHRDQLLEGMNHQRFVVRELGVLPPVLCSPFEDEEDVQPRNHEVPDADGVASGVPMLYGVRMLQISDL